MMISSPKPTRPAPEYTTTPAAVARTGWPLVPAMSTPCLVASPATKRPTIAPSAGQRQLMLLLIAVVGDVVAAGAVLPGRGAVTTVVGARAGLPPLPPGNRRSDWPG
ncbi:hypothetical protein D3C71_1451560 [compost metagenome]